MKLDEYVDLRNKDTRISPLLDLAPYGRVMPLLSSHLKKFVIATPPRPFEGFSGK